MSPIDDELRAALHGRAATLAPSPDPLAGIQRRAGRIRRNRAVTAVLGSALAVAAIAVAVPAVTTSAVPAPQTPAASAGPDRVDGSRALDPRAPWAYRGQALPPGLVDTVTREVAARRGTAPSALELTPLFGQVLEPGGAFELVFLVGLDGGATRWGVARTGEAGPELLVDAAVDAGATALASTLPGDRTLPGGTVPRLLVVASPEAGAVEYAPDGASEYARAAAPAPGIGVIAADGDRATDGIRLLDRSGTEYSRGPAPDLGAQPAPANLLDWPQRGVRSEGPPDQAVLDRLTAAGYADPQFRWLFSGSDDAGVRSVFGQAWSGAGPAFTVALATGGTQGEQLLLGPDTPPDPPVLAFVVCCSPGTSTETLVVVPQPRTGQVLYDDDGAGPFRPVGEGQDQLDGVVLVDRDPAAQDDRLQLLDGDGDLDRPTFQGPVSTLLCGRTECG